MIVENESRSKLGKNSPLAEKIEDHSIHVVTYNYFIAVPNLYPRQLIKLYHFKLFITLIYSRTNIWLSSVILIQEVDRLQY